MNDQGEKTCPLCAEDMDLTDQQLKPCKCGYEICVWCWHQIMDMAEKDETEGRCPACRTAYDKEKIVATAANCERFVAEVNMEKKTKSQKSKGKTSEGPKQLTSVRVIQRNLVYIVGLPLNLADEDLLQHREYFGQYGKVLKVSMSRTAAGVIQQFPNNSCSVYITYSKEEEAIRCIQNVHQFVLEGKPLRACFGTTKYCHAWLRNLHCSNPDCLYLHEIGSQEDSFTKDEIISAYTRSRVQQVTGAAINMQGRSGNVLPPPVDDYGNNNSASTGKSMVNNASSNNGTVIKESLPNGNSGRSLPAAASWGSRGSDCQLHAASLACSNGPSNLKHESVSSTLAFSSAVAGTTQISKPFVNLGKRTSLNDASLDTNSKCDPEALKSSRSPASMDCQSYLSGHLIAPDGESNSVTLGDQSSSPPDSKGNSDNISMFPHNSTSIGHTREPRTYPETNGPDAADGDMETLCSEMLSMSMGRKFSNEHSSVQMQDNTVCDHVLNKAAGNQEVHEHYADHFRIPVTTETAGRGPALANGVSIPEQECDWISKFDKVVPNTSEVDNDVRSFDIQRLKDQEVGSCSTHLPPLASSLNGFDYRRSHSMQHVEAYGAIGSKAGSLFIDDKISDHSLLHSSSLSKKSNIYHEKLIGSTDAFDLTHMGRLPVDPAYTNGNVALDKGESSIISNILSLDSDMWDDSLTSQNLAKLLGGPDKQSASFKMSSSWKAQNNSQSRFSFARQEESNNQAFEIQPSPNVFGQMPKNHSFSHDLSGNASLYLDKHRMSNGLYPSDYNASENHGSNRSTLSNNYSAVSRAQVSAPPGFSVPSRAPPPGLTSHERVDQAVESLSGNHLLSPSPLLRNSYHSAHPRNSASTSDLEFMDPAILAVGEGRLHGGPSNRALDIGMNFPPQLGAFENEARHHLSMQQRSHSLQQNLRFSDHPGDSFSHLSSSSSYGLSSRLTDQSQLNNTSPFPQLSLQHSRNGLTQNGQWEGWNEVQGVNPRAIAEMLSNDRLGMNKLYNGFEDSKYRITRSGDLYNRTFGM